MILGRFATDEEEAEAIAGDVLKFRVTDFDASSAADPVPPAMACCAGDGPRWSARRD